MTPFPSPSGRGTGKDVAVFKRLEPIRD
jgi:hypothetical protein